MLWIHTFPDPVLADCKQDEEQSLLVMVSVKTMLYFEDEVGFTTGDSSYRYVY